MVQNSSVKVNIYHKQCEASGEIQPFAFSRYLNSFAVAELLSGLQVLIIKMNVTNIDMMSFFMALFLS